MAKSDYISDNLIHFRDQFRGRRPNISQTLGTNNIVPQNNEENSNDSSVDSNNTNTTNSINSATTVNENINATPMTSSQPKLYTPSSLLNSASKVSAENNFANNERELRDLGERLKREQAYLQVKVDDFNLALKEAKLFASTIDSLISQYEKFQAINSPEDARKLEHLRIAFFQAQGRFSAFNTNSSNNVNLSNNNLLEGPSKLDRFLLPGVSAGGIILLAIVLICLF
jgi:hypothetical protein